MGEYLTRIELENEVELENIVKQFNRNNGKSLTKAQFISYMVNRWVTKQAMDGYQGGNYGMAKKAGEGRGQNRFGGVKN